MATFEQLEQQTQQLCERLSNNPKGRGEIRQAFYDKYGFECQDGFNYGRSEMDFYDYEYHRGVLNPLDATPPGVNWWRNVNLKFIYFSELAGAMFEAGVTSPDAPNPTQKWLDFLSAPSPKTWYRAHNSSILTGSYLYLADAKAENAVEQQFLNVILYRLMYAQALVEDATFFGELGAFLADPRFFSVDLITHLPYFYPKKYPLVPNDLNMILGDVDAIKKEMAEDAKDDLEEVVDAVKDKLEDIGEGISHLKDKLFGHGTPEPEKEPQNTFIRGDGDGYDPGLIDLAEAEQVNILDNKIIMPNIERLMANVAKWNDLPFIPEYQRGGVAIYPDL